MQQTFAIEGMHCPACVNRVTQALKKVADAVEVTLEPARAVIDGPELLSVDEVQAAVAKAGDYRVSAA